MAQRRAHAIADPVAEGTLQGAGVGRDRGDSLDHLVGDAGEMRTQDRDDPGWQLVPRLVSHVSYLWHKFVAECRVSQRRILQAEHVGSDWSHVPSTQDRQPHRCPPPPCRAGRGHRPAVEPGDRSAGVDPAGGALRDHRARRDARLPPPVHAPRVRVVQGLPGDHRRDGLDGGRGLGHHLGGRPSQAPCLHRSGRRSAFAPRARPRLRRCGQGPVARPHRLAV